ncbi:MAG: hypothetical protein ACYS32_06570 [Planctomycetota bacterium]
MLEVFDVNDDQRNLIWKTLPFPKYIPHDMYVSDDGKYVVILDDSRRPEGEALEFYHHDKGKIKSYSREDILGLSEKVTGHYDEKAFSAPYSLFHKFETSTYFCSLVWTDKEFYWLVWNAATGDHIKANQKLADGIFKQAREQLRKHILKPWNYPNKIFACYFLSKLKKPEDRVMIEKLLEEDWFVTNPSITYKETLWTRLFEFFDINSTRKAELKFFYAHSSIRQFADMALSRWDRKKSYALSFRSDDYTYHYLGNVSVQVILTAKPTKSECLWVYLVPEMLDQDLWDNTRPAHYLYADFDGFNINYKIGRTVPCIFMGVTPGKYRLKAVWDRKKPFYNEHDKFYKPQNGDYESIDSPVIQVKAAQTIDIGTIQCDHKVKNK